MSHDVTCHVTAMSLKRKEKKNTIPIKSENERKKNKNCPCSKRLIISMESSELQQ